MWGSAVQHLGDLLAEPQAPVPVHQPHFNASACIQLLGVLPPSEAELRASALARIRTFMAQDIAFVPPPTIPRSSSGRRRRDASPPTSARSSSADSSRSNSANSSRSSRSSD
jgi:hypothetical protein